MHRAAIEQQKMAAITEVKNQIGNLVVEVSEKILRRELENKPEQEKYIKQLAEEVKAKLTALCSNPRFAGRYAKSLIDLSIEQDQLEAVYKDILYMNDLMRLSSEFVTILKSPVIASDKKQKVVEALTAGKIGIITTSFYSLLIKKGRESFLPEIVDAFIEQYKEYKGIHTVTLTTAMPVSDGVKNYIIKKIKEAGNMKEVELELSCAGKYHWWIYIGSGWKKSRC